MGDKYTEYIGIVGSRTYPVSRDTYNILSSKEKEEVELLAYNFVRSVFISDIIYSEYRGDVVIVSGGSWGIDRVASILAKEFNLNIIEYFAEWETYGKSAGFRRNTKIVALSDEIIAFWDGHSKGTENTINKAKKDNLKVKIYYPEDCYRFESKHDNSR